MPMYTENKRIGKSKQKKHYTIEHIRELLQLSPADVLLLDACARKTVDDVHTILSTADPSINPDLIRDKYLRTPLHIACSRQDDHTEATAITKLLIQYGADVNNGVGDIDGFQPMHMAVLAGNYHCVLLLLEEGANIPASDPFRLTPLLLAKLKLDNLRQAPSSSTSVDIHGRDNIMTTSTTNSNGSSSNDIGSKVQDMSETAKAEYEGLVSITEVLVKHLANKHMTTIGISLRTLSSPTTSSSSSSSSLLSTSSSSTTSSSSSSPPSHYGLSDSLFSKEQQDDALNETITCLTEQLSTMEMTETTTHFSNSNSLQARQSLNNLIDKIRKLGIQEK
ncbi:ankyrin repeat-containing domain protein [Halteromyces radiatus]|uniref:ankyrin repeat-containing domain protein n=1 Tax=Halteromyces radiatus TaxID=101107 RepID=UPI00221EFB84|nr:ankyrin repeat-containing domain protein [Halteromyces radiatus]KAI8089864.1 ankyrin repeat-containing domain protein [Halteromyces radiatus]